MVWHFFMVHDDYGARVGKMIGISAEDVRNLEPLAKQVLTEDDKRRLQGLGNERRQDRPEAWGQWTGSVEDRQATADDVLRGMRDVPANGAMGQAAE